jgi:hypothetical protein
LHSIVSIRESSGGKIRIAFNLVASNAMRVDLKI